MSVRQNDILYDRMFLRDVGKLPVGVQSKISACIELCECDVYDSRLHTKQLGSPFKGIFSFRVTRDYRVGFQFDAPFVIRLLIADRRDKVYERLLRRM
jgi:mRNA-degrading endonuclease RelE of RelBE toxin-antitoxin system